MMPKPAREEEIRVAVSIRIAASPADVWALIRPADTAVFLEPTIRRAFRIPGTPDGVGEMQGFISLRNGQEYIHVVEVMEEIPEQWALVRHVGSTDPAAATGYRLTGDASGTTFEYEQRLTVPAGRSGFTRHVRGQYEAAATTLLSRVKYVLEQETREQRGRHA
ncbi:SRPBCC family protein [Arthrobacter sp. B0490]|uniref:SRPBCC family protein n=1 Tax=Arthrobacter sp. B0490 TaxID=2058891 RepID=UPI000CE380E8|nr:SRPBCC family protein [Arthrobacter sp. B0490]